MHIMNRTHIENLIQKAEFIMYLEAEGLTEITTTFEPTRRSYVSTLKYTDGTERRTVLPLGMFTVEAKVEDVFDILINSHFEKQVRELSM